MLPVQIYNILDCETEYTSSSSISMYLDSNSSADSEDEPTSNIEDPIYRYNLKPIKDYYEDVAASCTNEEFVQHFRINRRTFSKLQKEYYRCLVYKSMCDKFGLISAGRSLAIFLWFAGHDTVSHRGLATRFNLPLKPVQHVLKSVTAFLSSKWEQVVVWPSFTRMTETAKSYQKLTGLRGAIGSIGLTHILMDPPLRDMKDYTDNTGQTNMAVLGICNEKNKFIYMLTGCPLGSDPTDLIPPCENSSLFEKLEASCPESHYLVGDNIFPCSPKLLVPYKDKKHLSDVQKHFNIKHNEVRREIDSTFRMLKLRFQQLNYLDVHGISYMNHFIKACVVLHNMSTDKDLQYLVEYVEMQEDFSKFAKHDDENEAHTKMRDMIAEQILNNN